MAKEKIRDGLFSLPTMYLLYGATELPKIEGEEILRDLFSGSKIVRAGFDGECWHVIVERPIKLKDAKGREDDTWKYAQYKTSTSFDGFYLASSWNYSPSEMRKRFLADFNEDRGYILMKQRNAAEVQA